MVPGKPKSSAAEVYGDRWAGKQRRQSQARRAASRRVLAEVGEKFENGAAEGVWTRQPSEGGVVDTVAASRVTGTAAEKARRIRGCFFSARGINCSVGEAPANPNWRDAGGVQLRRLHGTTVYSAQHQIRAHKRGARADIERWRLGREERRLMWRPGKASQSHKTRQHGGSSAVMG